MYQHSLGKKIKASIFQIILLEDHTQICTVRSFGVGYGMVESLDLSLIEMNRWLKLEGGREHWKTTKSRRKWKKDSRNFLNGKTLLSFQMVLLVQYVPKLSMYHSLHSSSSSFYFDGINRTQKEKLLLGLLHFLFQINYA